MPLLCSLTRTVARLASALGEASAGTGRVALVGGEALAHDGAPRGLRKAVRRELPARSAVAGPVDAEPGVRRHAVLRALLGDDVRDVRVAGVASGTVGEQMPEGFQTAEFQRDHGMVDRIVHRLALKGDLERLLGFTS
jgi:hypothetical protein